MGFVQNWTEKFRHSCEMQATELSSIFLDSDWATGIVFDVFYNWLPWKTAYWYIIFTVNWENDLMPEWRIIERVFIVLFLPSLGLEEARRQQAGWCPAKALFSSAATSECSWIVFQSRESLNPTELQSLDLWLNLLETGFYKGEKAVPAVWRWLPRTGHEAGPQQQMEWQGLGFIKED